MWRRFPQTKHTIWKKTEKHVWEVADFISNKPFFFLGHQNLCDPDHKLLWICNMLGRMDSNNESKFNKTGSNKSIVQPRIERRNLKQSVNLTPQGRNRTSNALHEWDTLVHLLKGDWQTEVALWKKWTRITSLLQCHLSQSNTFETRDGSDRATCSMLPISLKCPANPLKSKLGRVE